MRGDEITGRKGSAGRDQAAIGGNRSSSVRNEQACFPERHDWLRNSQEHLHPCWMEEGMVRDTTHKLTLTTSLCRVEEYESALRDWEENRPPGSASSADPFSSRKKMETQVQ